MYGILHAGLKALIDEVGRPGAWTRVLERANQVEPATLHFVRYSDEETLGLVEATAEELGITPDQALSAFGRHWVKWAADNGYGAWLTTRRDLFASLDALDNMHTRLSVTFPGYEPPSFSCERHGPGEAVVTWRSRRGGLAPMIPSMIEALGERLGQPCRVVAEGRSVDGARFRVTLIEGQTL